MLEILNTLSGPLYLIPEPGMRPVLFVQDRLGRCSMAHRGRMAGSKFAARMSST